MTIEKVRVLAEKNTMGIPKVIYIKGENLQDLVKAYEKICSLLSIEGCKKVLKSDFALLSYDREYVNSYIIESLKNGFNTDEILETAKSLIKNDWSYFLRKDLDKRNIPYINKDNNCVQVGYGENSLDLYEGDDNISLLKNYGNIPIISITGTNGKTTTARLIHNTLGLLGYKSGLSSTGGIYIKNENIKNGDTTGYYSALEVLKSKKINVAVLETARGGLIKKGLGFKNATAGIITSLSNDHMGMEGVNTLQELGRIKSLIKEGLSNNGVMIIRAQKIIVDLFSKDDKLILFENEENDLIKNHIKSGGEAFYIKNEVLINNVNKEEIKLENINEFEFAHYGASKSNIRNIMSAIASIKQFHKNTNEIVMAIKKLKCDMKTNKGRQNIIDINDFKLIIDYGHNSEAFEEVFSIAKSFNPKKLTGIITAAGDRDSFYITELGEIAAKYCDTIIIKEHEDKRGRALGEVAKLLYKGVKNTGFKDENIHILLTEEEALSYGLQNAIEGEVIVSFSQFLDKTMPVVNKFINSTLN